MSNDQHGRPRFAAVAPRALPAQLITRNSPLRRCVAPSWSPSVQLAIRYFQLTISANLPQAPTIPPPSPPPPQSRAILPTEVQPQMPNRLAEFSALSAPSAVHTRGADGPDLVARQGPRPPRRPGWSPAGTLRPREGAGRYNVCGRESL